MINEFIKYSTNLYKSRFVPKFLKRLAIDDDVDDWFDKKIDPLMFDTKYISFSDLYYIINLIRISKHHSFEKDPTFFDNKDNIFYTILVDNENKWISMELKKESTITVGRDIMLKIVLYEDGRDSIFVYRSINNQIDVERVNTKKSSIHDGYIIELYNFYNIFHIIYSTEKEEKEFKRLIKNALKDIIIYYACNKGKLS